MIRRIAGIALLAAWIFGAGFLLNPSRSRAQIISGNNSSGGISVAQVDLTGQTANIAATTILTPAANGFYRFSGWCVKTVAGGTSSTLPAVTVSFSDAETGATHTSTITSTNTVNTQGAAGPASDPASFLTNNAFYAKSGTAIQYATIGYASAGSAMQYALHIRLEGPF